jgi:hypothetical protein
VINGQCAGDFSGWSVSAAGDVNGDGLADLIVGAGRSDPAAGSDAGRSYVVFGKTGGSAVDLSAIAAGSGGFVINGECAGDFSGYKSVSAAGDVNGDGLADLIVGAPEHPAAGLGAGDAATSSSAAPAAPSPRAPSTNSAPPTPTRSPAPPPPKRSSPAPATTR